MKKFVFALVTLFTITVSASAMSYEQARNEALFLTDKMAYELNLTEDQYEAAYEINLDYLLRVNTVDDLYGTYWRYRNLDLSYILFDWQYRAFCDATYFYRPYTGREASGTSASTPATRTATTSTSDVLRSTLNTAEDTAGR